MMRAAIRRRQRPFVAGLTATALTGAWLWMWHRAGEESCGASSCFGDGILVAVLGLPVVLAGCYAAFRLCGALTPLVCTVVLVTVAVIAPPVLEFLEPPIAVWPFLLGLIATAYLWLERALTDPDR